MGNLTKVNEISVELHLAPQVNETTRYMRLPLLSFLLHLLSLLDEH